MKTWQRKITFGHLYLNFKFFPICYWSVKENSINKMKGENWLKLTFILFWELQYLLIKFIKKKFRRKIVKHNFQKQVFQHFSCNFDTHVHFRGKGGINEKLCTESENLRSWYLPMLRLSKRLFSSQFIQVHKKIAESGQLFIIFR